MKKIVLFVFFSFTITSICAQFDNQNGQGSSQNNSGGGMFGGGNNNQSSTASDDTTIKLSGETKYTDYKMFSVNNDTTYIDTTLTLKKDFKFNYIRKDNFELLAFHNQGQTFNKLGYNFNNKGIFPLMGIDAKQFNYKTVEDIQYYYVPTPTTEVLYRTGLEQGQVLDAFITMNTSKQFNFSLAYKGLRSLGKYRQALSSHGNFRYTFNYHSKNELYNLKGHFSSFDFLNYENGGLTEESINYFEGNDPNYIERGRLDVNYSDAESLLEGKRYYINQSYSLYSKKHSVRKAFSFKENIQKNRLDSINKSILKIQKDSISADSIKELNINLKKLKASKVDTLSIKPIDSINIDSIKQLNIDFKKLDTAKVDSVFIPKKQIDSLNIKSIKNDTLTKPVIKIDSLEVVSKKTDLLAPLEFTLDEVKISELRTSSKIIKDSLKINKKDLDSLLQITDIVELNLGHIFTYETKHYRFTKSSAGSVFGETFGSSLSDHTSYQNMENQLYLELKTPKIGVLRTKINHYKYNYHYNSILYYDDLTIEDKLKGNTIAAGANWKTSIGKFYLDADANSIISGDFTGSSIKASLGFKKDSVYNFKGFAEVASKSPSLNKILYQSSYKDYNWSNNFKNEDVKSLGVEFKLNKWGSINASYNLIDNYTYFDTISKPTQASETLNYLKVKAHQYFTYKKFTIDNTVMYQNVLEGESFFRVPQIVTRNTIYFSDYVFKGDPLYLQTGITFKYFTSFKSNAFNPLLNEFVLQDDTEIGNFPILDFFFNMQVRRTRIYLKVENFGASFLGRNYYSAPNYPYRDLTVRFGLVWNFFI
ncbi:putative porin [Lutibacter citreus]|uniref:putative porin n=1 Tax=Lutibacter citreus TaxID=2138210 RepID=UPI0013001A09|nr:putative porin [Lutibacter citreus]